MTRGGGIKKIQNLFDKYTTILKAPQSTVINTTIEVIVDILQYEVKKESIRYNTNAKILYITISGPLKSEIILHKKDILTHLKGRLGAQNAPKDII